MRLKRIEQAREQYLKESQFLNQQKQAGYQKKQPKEEDKKQEATGGRGQNDIKGRGGRGRPEGNRQNGGRQEGGR